MREELLVLIIVEMTWVDTDSVDEWSFSGAFLFLFGQLLVVKVASVNQYIILVTRDCKDWLLGSISALIEHPAGLRITVPKVIATKAGDVVVGVFLTMMVLFLANDYSTRELTSTWSF